MEIESVYKRSVCRHLHEFRLLLPAELPHLPHDRPPDLDPGLGIQTLDDAHHQDVGLGSADLLASGALVEVFLGQRENLVE